MRLFEVYPGVWMWEDQIGIFSAFPLSVPSVPSVVQPFFPQ